MKGCNLQHGVSSQNSSTWMSCICPTDNVLSKSSIDVMSTVLQGMSCPMSSMWLSCPMSNKGCHVQCPTRAVMSNVQQCCHVHCPMSNRAVMSIVQCPTGAVMSDVQQRLSCPMSNRGCHVQRPTGAVMSIVQQGLSCPTSNRGCHVQRPIGAVMSNVQQELSCPMSNRGCHVQRPT